jgi:hypothetical protein
MFLAQATLAVVLGMSGTVCALAQDTVLPFDSSRYSLVLPPKEPKGPVIKLNRLAPNAGKPCAVIRVVHPNAQIDPKIAATAIPPVIHDPIAVNVPIPACPQ